MVLVAGLLPTNWQSLLDSCPDSLGGLTRKYLLNKDKMLEEEDVYIQLVLPRLLLITVSSSLII